MRVVCAGGGTLGPVTPLLAVVEELKASVPSLEVQWFGTTHGPERLVVEAQGLPFRPVSSGKLRRYWSWRNFSDAVRICMGVVQAVAWLARHPVDVVISAGGYVAVPVGFAAWFWRVPLLVHQQDVRLSLTNKLLSPFASRFTLAWPGSAVHFPRAKAVVTGNPVRQKFFHRSRAEARTALGLSPDRPVVTILGGGTGAEAINQCVVGALPELTTLAQVVHLAGHGKAGSLISPNQNYHPFDFMIDTSPALAAADVVVTRAGMGVLGELGALSQAAIVVPLPQSHQEDNAKLLAERQAAVVLFEPALTPSQLVATVSQLLRAPDLVNTLGANLHKLFPASAAAAVAREVLSLVKHP